MEEFRKEFEEYEEMFQSTGWKKLVENATNQHKNIMDSSVHAAPTNDQWQFLRGQVTQLEQMLGFESYVTQSLRQLDEIRDNPDASELNTLES